MAHDRNFDGIHFEKIRKKIDGKFNDAHDELSDCYYQKKPYRDKGILTKEQFDILHGLIFFYYDIEFHKENMKQTKKDQYPESVYHEIEMPNGVKKTKTSIALEAIQKAKEKGLALDWLSL
jgi:hypothetical protein